MSSIPFSKDELEVVREVPVYRRPNLPKIPIYNFPFRQETLFTPFIKKNLYGS